MSRIQEEYVLYNELKNYGCMEKCVMVTTVHALSVAIRFLTATLAREMAVKGDRVKWSDWNTCYYGLGEGSER